MRLHNGDRTRRTSDTGMGLKWQPAGVNNIAGVNNSTFTPSTPGLGTKSWKVIPDDESGLWPLAHRDSLDASTTPQVKLAPERTSSPLEFRQVTDAAHKTKSRSRLRRFIDYLFHPKKYLVHRKELKAAKAAENIKAMLSEPTFFRVDGRYEALHKGLLSDFAQFLSAGKTLLRSQQKVHYLSQYEALGALLKENVPLEMLLDDELTEGWCTVLPAFAEFARDFRQSITPCNLLIAKIMETATLHPDEFLSECVPDWSTRFDAKRTTTMQSAPEWVRPRLEAYLSEAKQRLQALDNSRVIHF